MVQRVNIIKLIPKSVHVEEYTLLVGEVKEECNAVRPGLFLQWKSKLRSNHTTAPIENCAAGWNLPKCPPDVEAHDVEPRECGYESEKYTVTWKQEVKLSMHSVLWVCYPLHKYDLFRDYVIFAWQKERKKHVTNINQHHKANSITLGHPSTATARMCLKYTRKVPGEFQRKFVTNEFRQFYTLYLLSYMVQICLLRTYYVFCTPRL
jgi:hypothetical protein